MTRARITSLGCGIALVIAAAAFWLGMREGMRLGVMSESTPRGAIAEFHLRALNAGRPGSIRVTLDRDVDMALIHAYRVHEHPLVPLLEPVWGYPMKYDAEILPRIASYRKATPSPVRQELLKEEPASSDREGRERRAELQEANRIIDLMVQRYAGR